jgi:hypothetical protein
MFTSPERRDAIEYYDCFSRDIHKSSRGIFDRDSPGRSSSRTALMEPESLKRTGDPGIVQACLRQ